MADHDLTTPMLSPRSSDQPQTIITVSDDDDSPADPPDQPPPTQRPYLHIQSRNLVDSPPGNSRNPYEFLALDELSLPAPPTVDPFRNGTPRIDGVYEVLKIVLCLPIALTRLVLFGLCLGVGYIATRIALEGWKDKENPMPRWRCRVMWVTRMCARIILFSFGYHWIRRKGKAASREVAPIVASNHVSYIEPIFYFYELFPTIVAAESHDSTPFVGTIIRAMQVIYVNRFSPSSRKYAVNEIKKSAFKDLNTEKGFL